MTSEPASRQYSDTDNVRRIWAKLPPRRKKQFGLVLLLLIMSVFLEAVTITLVVPLIDALARPERVHQLVLVPFEALGGRGENELRIFMSLVFVLFVLASAGLRMLYLWASMWLSFAVGADFTEMAFRRTLALPYAEQTQFNSSDMLTSLMVKMQAIVFHCLVPIMSAVGALILAVAIVTTLLALSPYVTMMLMVLIVVLVGVVVTALRKPLQRTGEMVARLQPQFMERMQVARGGIREIILDGTQGFFASELSRIQRELRHYQAVGAFLASAPRFLMEAVFMLSIIGLAFWTFRTADDPMAVIPQLSLIALGIMKILPSVQLLVLNWATISNGRTGVRDALDLVELQARSKAADVVVTGDAPGPPFTREIRLTDVWFRYSDDTHDILRGVDLTIRRGERIGVIGQTGAGKSTLIDLIMGLLTPTKGQIEVDGVVLDSTNLFAWRRQVAHVPQNIYLTDASVAENIAFGMPVEQIRRDRVVDAAQRASIARFVDDGEAGFVTLVGERGMRISGGQRQRIGIARALYKSADLIVLDEATSALDGETEARIMQTILDLGRDKTVVMIAHRLTTLKDCDRVIEMDAGQVVRICKYADLCK